MYFSSFAKLPKHTILHAVNQI